MQKCMQFYFESRKIGNPREKVFICEDGGRKVKGRRGRVAEDGRAQFNFPRGRSQRRGAPLAGINCQ